MECQGCFEKLTVDNRKVYREHRLANHHVNELCDACLKYFVVRGVIMGKNRYGL